jgi:hypothetical protein
MYVPDVYEIPDLRDGKLTAWLTALAITAIVLGATVALVAVNYMPSEAFQITVRG